jgi:uncharacterized protein YbjT (DUF2867 family)
MRIAVAGGTGLVGGMTVRALERAGHEPVVISRSTGANTITGDGMDEALQGVEAVVDATSTNELEADATRAFFGTSTKNLLAAEERAGVGHHVVLSIVGVDRIPDNGHYAGKIRQEEVAEAGPVPVTILRATQFFEFAGQLADVSTDGDTVRLPHSLFRPQAAEDVSAALAEIAVAAPVNGIVEQQGPEALALDDFVREVLRARGDSRDVVTGPDARYFGAEVDDRSLVPDNGARVAPTRLADWLSDSMVGR